MSGPSVPREPKAPGEQEGQRPLTKNIPTPFLSSAEPLSLGEYEKAGGYESVRKILQGPGLTSSEVIEAVKQSNLKGRGGAGFSTAFKMSAVPMGTKAARPKYLIANADEMEPGTFKDRLLMEGDPHLLLEGMLIAAFAIEADIAYIFIRGEYKLAQQRLNQAISEAYGAGYFGKNILGTDFSLELYLHISVGRYICGEETALINALEGKRANPRSKPPYPQVSGLWGKPTVVQNVETLCNLPHIITKGADWYKSLGRAEDAGTKIYGVSGRVKRPGAWELPMGTKIREILEEQAGGMREGFQFRGLLPGGASTEFLLEEHLETPMDFVSLQKIGARMGTGTMIILDDRTCPVGLLLNLEKFFQQESCGWCTPCRDGLPWVAQILEGLERGEGREEDLEFLAFHTKWLGPGCTFCALAPGAMSPLQSALKYFRQDFERHVSLKRCPWRT